MNLRIFKLCCILGLLAVCQSLPQSKRGILRRVYRQSYSRIPYAKLAIGKIPKRFQNRLRGSSRPSSSSASVGSNGGSSLSGDPTPSDGGASTGYGSSAYGRTSSGYQFGGGGGGYSNPAVGQSYGQPQYNQQSRARVPTGTSTFPYGTGRITGSNQNPYSSQQLPVASYGGRGGSGRSSGSSWYPNQQQPMGYGAEMPQVYPPYGGNGARGYGENYRMGGDPRYAGGGGGGTPYGGSYGGMLQRSGGYYSTGYTGGGYSNIPRGATIGSPYRDPNSPYSSYVHPNADSTGRSNGNSGSYGQGRGGSSSYHTSSSYRGSNSYGRGNSQTGYSRGGGGSSYYGGGSSGGRGSTYGYGQSQPSASSVGSSSSRYGGSTGQYGAGSENSHRSYGGSSPSGSSYSDRTSYGQTSGGARYGSTANGRQYGQTGSSNFGSSSDRRYGGYSQTTGMGQQGTGSQSSYRNYGGVADNAGEAGAGQSGSYFNPGSSAESNGAGASSRYPQYSRVEQSSQTSRTDSGAGRSGTAGRFYNPGSGPSQSASGSQKYGTQSVPDYSQQYQSGGFYNPSAAEESPDSSLSPRPDGYAPTGNSTDQAGIHQAQSDSPSLVRMREVERVEENRANQDGIFFVPRRNGAGPNSERGNKAEKSGRNRHPSLNKCDKLGDGLPDLYIDHRKMRKSVFLDRKTLDQLACAKSENCLPKSAEGPKAIFMRKLLRFATIAHNNGTADFLPDLHYSDWTFHRCHDHYHSMKEFAHFHLINSNGTVVAEGHKVSFCLQDSGCKNPCNKSYFCTPDTQGISPGCYDSYLASRDCQWIDITHVAPGSYVLRVTVNPPVNGIRAVPELSYTNNIAECQVTIAVNSAEANKCWVK